MIKKYWTAFDVVALLMTVIYPVIITVEGRWNAWRILLSAALALQFVAFVWAGSPIRREIAAGDPNPWQFLRWMDISGPSGHEHGVHEELYLRRLYVWRTPWFGLMLHWIKREDWDRDAPHTHPWGVFYAAILSGGYTEQVYEVPVDGQPFDPSKSKRELTWNRLSVHKMTQKHSHRISAVRPRTVSLVLNGPKRSTWGFWVEGNTQMIPWKSYVNGAR